MEVMTFLPNESTNLIRVTTSLVFKNQRHAPKYGNLIIPQTSYNITSIKSKVQCLKGVNSNDKYLAYL